VCTVVRVCRTGSRRFLRLLVAPAVLTAALAACGGGGGPSLPAGVAAAEGTAPAIAGETLGGGTLPDLSGRVLVVNFWNPYCVPCRVEAPVLEAASKRYADRGVTVVGVHYTGEQWPRSVDAATSFLRAAHVDYPVVADPGADLAAGFGIRGIPSTVIVDAGGELRYRVLGKVRTAVLDDLLDRMLAGPVTT
jgi:thiol-disulfide isomerase/thioredoxin